MVKSNKTVYITLIIIVGLYCFMSYNGYKSIVSTYDKAEEQYQTIVHEVSQGNTYIHTHLQSYNSLVTSYERQQKLIPTFWQKWIFTFPELEHAEYNHFINPANNDT